MRFTSETRSDVYKRQGGYRVGRTLAGYPHIHFWNRPELAKRLWGIET